MDQLVPVMEEIAGLLENEKEFRAAIAGAKIKKASRQSMTNESLDAQVKRMEQQAKMKNVTPFLVEYKHGKHKK